MKRFKNILGVALVGLAVNASAVEISFLQYGVGTWASVPPPLGFNSDGTVLAGVQHSVQVWNGTALPGLFTQSFPPGPDQSATFVKGAGSAVPAFLPAPLADLGKDESAPYASIDNSGGLYSYVLGKYGNEAYLFYIGGLTDSAITLPTARLSHQVVFSAARVRVPDAGATALLLGLALAALAPFTRKAISR